MTHGHEIDPPEELPCRGCYDREHRPRAQRILVDAFDAIFDDAFKAKVYAASAIFEPWFKGFRGALDSAYEDTVPDREWTTCSRCAGEIQADMAEDL